MTGRQWWVLQPRTGAFGQTHLADPRRTSESGAPGRCLDDPTRPEEPPDTAGADQSRPHDLAAVPPRASRHDAGLRLRPRRLRHHRATDLRVLRHRDQHPLPPHPRNHHQPRPTLDHPASTQPRRRPRCLHSRLPDPDPRPRRTVHSRVRHRLRRGIQVVKIPPRCKPTALPNASCGRSEPNSPIVC